MNLFKRIESVIYFYTSLTDETKVLPTLLGERGECQKAVFDCDQDEGGIDEDHGAPSRGHQGARAIGLVSHQAPDCPDFPSHSRALQGVQDVFGVMFSY
jgi:hypothetical protein